VKAFISMSSTKLLISQAQKSFGESDLDTTERLVNCYDSYDV